MVALSRFILINLILFSPLSFAKKKVNAWKQITSSSLRSLDENKYIAANSSKNFKVVVFWASWCDYCHEELRDFNLFYDQMVTAETDLLAVSLDEQLSDAQNFLKNRSYKFPLRWNADKKLRQQLDIPKLPLAMILNRDGDLVTAYSGYSKERFSLIKKRVYALSRNEGDE